METAQKAQAGALKIAATAPTPTPGFWNGEGVPGSPKIIASLGEQKSYFFSKGNSSSANRPSPPARRGFRLRQATIKCSRKTKITSRPCSAIMWTTSATSRNRISTPAKIRGHVARISTARGCPTPCFSGAATPCIKVTFRRMRPRTVASACRKEWPGRFFRCRLGGNAGRREGIGFRLCAVAAALVAANPPCLRAD